MDNNNKEKFHENYIEGRNARGIPFGKDNRQAFCA